MRNLGIVRFFKNSASVKSHSSNYPINSKFGQHTILFTIKLTRNTTTFCTSLEIIELETIPMTAILDARPQTESNMESSEDLFESKLL